MVGAGSVDRILGGEEIARLCTEFVGREALKGKRVLAIIPDSTRSGPIDVMFRTLYALLSRGPGRLDFLIALGTHPPMTEEAIDARLGLAPGERASSYPLTRVFNHHWNDPEQLRSIGVISSGRVEEISGGMMREEVNVTINKLVFDYDVVLVVGPTFPHEVVGFSGGNKYLFPGISGQEIINMFHWLGALITNPRIIGKKHTPVRKVVDVAAAMLPVPRLCMSLVVKGTGLAGLYCGTPEEAWEAASDLSDRIHITYKKKPFTSVLSCAPAMYDDLWVGGKCAYKLEPVVADGGELIIYAPHIREISFTHGRIIESIGYHVRDYFTGQAERFLTVPRGVVAHSTHVKGVGTYRDGVEHPRINVVLATGIPQETCRRINLGYRDPASVDAAAWQGKEGEGILHVPHAGEILYRLFDDPFAGTETKH
jgi:nickel-dependent lactate racemase